MTYSECPLLQWYFTQYIVPWTSQLTELIGLGAPQGADAVKSVNGCT